LKSLTIQKKKKFLNGVTAEVENQLKELGVEVLTFFFFFLFLFIFSFQLID